MVAQVRPTDDELYLYALLTDGSGRDIAEFCWVDETPGKSDACFRLWDFQWPWYGDTATYQIDQASRTLGKSEGIAMRACAHPFNFPGQERLITAPELNHLAPVTGNIEKRIKQVWFLREMCPSDRHMGISRQPQWQIKFKNGGEIRSRLPNKDGKGVKGCLAPGVLVLTSRGQVPVEDVVIGDEVLTHLGRWRKVLGTPSYANPDAVEVVGGGHRGLIMSDNHRMFGRRNRNPQRTRNLESPTWCVPGEDSEVEQRWYFGSPTRFPATQSPIAAEVAWVVGRYVADGFLSFQRKRGITTSGRLHVIVRFEKCDDVVQAMKQAGLHPTARLRDNGTYDVEVSDTTLCRWVDAEFGQHAEAKHLPVWLLGCEPVVQRAFLDGYLSGDGHWDAGKHRWTASTASKSLAVSLRLLAQSLGYVCGLSWVDPKVAEVRGRPLVAKPRRSWRVTMTESDRNAVIEDGISWQKVRKISPIGEIPVVHELVVEGDCSYIADGLISHNQHPVVIELDEAQDYPEPGWTEIIECLKEVPNAQWRAHGVPKGIRDRFWKFTTGADPALPWKVHRVMAMQRPTWNPQERDRKVAMYGGNRTNPDYRRNIYGEHGDASSPLFVLARLMACVDMDQESAYNTEIYTRLTIIDEDLAALREGFDLQLSDGSPNPELPGVDSILETAVPGSHKVGYSAYYGGMDLGLTNHPSELLIFGQVEKGGRMRLLLRIHMERVRLEDQEAVVRWLQTFYGKDKFHFGMDRAGLGQRSAQTLADGTIQDGLIVPYGKVGRVQGWDFMEKVVVELDVEKDGEIEDQMVYRHMIDYSSEELRTWVDAKKLELPSDFDLLNQWQGQTTSNPKGADIDPNRPKRSYSKGVFHALDAGKYMIASRTLPGLHEMIEVARHSRKRTLPRTLIPGAMMG